MVWGGGGRGASSGRRLRYRCSPVANAHAPGRIRGVLAFALRVVGGGAAWCAALVLLAWVVGRVASDRWLWSQFLSWIPSLVALCGGLVLVAISWTLGALSRRARGGRAWRRRTVFERAGVVLLAACGLLLVWMVGVEWRAYRYVTGLWAGNGGEGLRLVYWNPATPIPGFVERLAEEEADLYAIANQPGHRDVESLRDVMMDRERGWTSVRAGRMACVSKLPILRWAFLRSAVEGRVWFGSRRVVDGREVVRREAARALFVEVEWEGEPLVIWIVDVPSDPLLHRPAMLRSIRNSIESWRGTVMTVEGESWRSVLEREGRFPAPDVIVGDFNTPRGAWSLRELVGGMRGGFEQAGRGRVATFPRLFALWHIDQLFTGEGVGVETYETFDPGVSLHCGQRAVLRRERPTDRGR